jgi:hypothetical protein
MLSITAANATVSFFGSALFNPTSEDGSITLAAGSQAVFYTASQDILDAIANDDINIFNTLAAEYVIGTSKPLFQAGPNVLVTGQTGVTLSADFNTGDSFAIIVDDSHIFVQSSWVAPSDGANATISNVTTAALSVPEPSTYALLAGFAAFIFVAIRRRNS